MTIGVVFRAATTAIATTVAVVAVKLTATTMMKIIAAKTAKLKDQENE